MFEEIKEGQYGWRVIKEVEKNKKFSKEGMGHTM